MTELREFLKSCSSTYLKELYKELLIVTSKDEVKRNLQENSKYKRILNGYGNNIEVNSINELAIILEIYEEMAFRFFKNLDKYSKIEAIFSNMGKDFVEIKELVNFNNFEDKNKLTTDVFIREECPDWAICAVVEQSGKAYYLNSFCGLKATTKGFENPNNILFQEISGTFDNTNWENSMIFKGGW